LNDTQGSHRNFYTPLPRSKVGTDKRIRSDKERQTKKKKELLHARDE